MFTIRMATIPASPADLTTDPKKGLSKARAMELQRSYGFNEVPEKRASPALQFARRFWGVAPWMLEVTMVLSVLLGKFLQFYIITTLLLFNALIGFFLERQAEAVVAGLRSKLRVNSRVLRDGEWTVVPARELVPGDIVRLRAGDFVPADIRNLSGRLEVDQSALTGESMTVQKNPQETLYSGSIVRRGESQGTVLSTGRATFYGKTTELVETARPRLHMEEVTSGVVRWLLTMVITLLVVAFILSFIRGLDLLDLLPLSLVLLISAIPVALPTMFVISMAVGSVDLARKGVLITRLSSVEDAATMDTLCVDKTGTITLNRLAITAILPLNGFHESDVVFYGALASNEANHDPIDLAFLASAQTLAPTISTFSQVEFSPFDPETKRTEALVEKDQKRTRVMKGAVETLAAMSGVSEEEMVEIEHHMSNFAKSAYRTLAVAVSSENGPLRLAGLVALWDPPRADSAQLVRALAGLGVSVKMLTGDAIPVAEEVAKKIGLGKEIVEAKQLQKLLKDDPESAAELAERSDGFAEVYPSDKYAIVKGLQKRKHVVGMTGDGVNDAPALKQAEVGIAVTGATDVAKSAASVVLTSEGLTNIVDLVPLGRVIYQRIVTWTVNKVVKTFEIVVFASLTLILLGYTVVGTFQVVLLLLLGDFVTIALASDRQRWSPRPETWNIRSIVWVGVALGILTLIEHFGLLFVALHFLGLSSDISQLNTFALGMLFYSGMFTLLIIRERRRFWSSRPSKPLFTALLLDMVFVGVISTIGLPGLTSLPLSYTLGIIAYYAFFVLIANDSIKTYLVRRGDLSW